jgi:hypothetical protein
MKRHNKAGGFKARKLSRRLRKEGAMRERYLRNMGRKKAPGWQNSESKIWSLLGYQRRIK